MAVKLHPVLEDFIEFITSSPSLEQIVDFTLSEPAQARVSELLDANRNRRLTDEETAELDEFQRIDHMVRRAKIRALQKLAERQTHP
jgi:hypothetical protein